jgi:2-polyprenyl-6-methoxyphenol hydroxylase-like FAD-dependent oxidoreductase
MGLVITGDGIGSFFSHPSPGRLLWGLSKWEKDGPRDGYDKTDPKAFEALMAESREMAKGIAEPMATIISKTTNPEMSFIVPARDKQPFGHGGDLPENVVFIGDANHTVSSFAGTGANLAMKDGWDLATELCKSDSASGAAAAYDKIALPRANKTLKESRDRMGQCHTSGWKWTMLRTAISAGSLFVGK